MNCIKRLILKIKTHVKKSVEGEDVIVNIYGLKNGVVRLDGRPCFFIRDFKLNWYKNDFFFQSEDLSQNSSIDECIIGEESFISNDSNFEELEDSHLGNPF